MSTAFDRRVSRRGVLGGLVAAPTLAGCANVVEGVANSCPEDLADSGGVTWIPDVAHPVLFGVEELGRADGAPGDMVIYYPAARRRLNNRGPLPVLEMCVARWPVVLFLHGQPPTGISRVGWHRKWGRMLSTIARSGYVVVAPSHNEQLVIADPEPAVTAAVRTIDFVQHEWSAAAWVDKRRSSTVVAGHSFGALLAAHVAATPFRDVGALVCLGGGFRDGDAARALSALQSVTAPTFLMWSVGAIAPDDENLNEAAISVGDNPAVWDALAQPRYAAVYQGGHFDYLDPSDTGDALRGTCPYVGAMAGDLMALFIASNIASLTRVGVDLRKPQVQLTPQQQRYAEGHLAGLDQFTGPGCRLDLRWAIDGAAGARAFGLGGV